MNLAIKKLSRSTIRDISRESIRRAESLLFHRGKIEDRLFIKQNNFINDKSQLKAALCTRRAGKSYACGKILVQKALKFDDSVQVYIAKTRDSAKRIMMPVMKSLKNRYSINMKLNKSELSFTFANGSVIYFVGLDSDENQKDKILGQALLTAIIDEAAFFETNLNDLVYEHLLACTADWGDDGQIIMISTPSDITSGLFYDVTTGKEQGWSTHKWSTSDNPYMAEKIANQIALLKKNKPGIEDTPLFKRMYLAIWFVDDEALVYKIKRDKNVIDGRNLSFIPNDKWTTILSIDLGFNDDSAFVVMSYCGDDPNLYIRYAFKKPGMIVSDVAAQIKHIESKFKIDVKICDPASKQVVEELNQRHGMDIISATKSDKKEFIELLNSDLITGAIKIIDEPCEELITEATTLIWNEEKKKRKIWEELSSCPNHLTDAMLYGWRYCYQFTYKPANINDIENMDPCDEYWDREKQKIKNEEMDPYAV